ncbi:hypothetical protein ACUHOO_000791 [Pseudomonas aeruginosa]|jgi:hypothetical protein|uniref:hypothetical protein n=1 Tax=Pseudomonas aeruginosa TaxID=287 RepID=UPI00037C3BEB|nr:hypothetical protein [Pseudomonas aeruginosa]EIU3316459.1 hypothetical protein [Pseudomonas aeruginosa]EIY2512150.1 hypothetical protein [Pseudomonas aeruginosa]EIY2820322.1 hypothetical protein [Pseudomonas aeruginosa]EKT8668880.1 hypothetical protein [Pseudomonas aeruginosa]EKU2957373.1 hypothetical protein [Pseudomonas aeruginosa]
MASQKKPRSRFDWEAVERDYRTGRFSNRELSRLHGPSEGAIRKRAADHGWQRDLSEQIRLRVQALTGRAAAEATEAARTDAEVVEQAAEAGAEIIRGHQVLIRRAKDVTEGYLGRLGEQVAAGKLLIQIRDKVVEVDIPLDYVGKSLGYATASLERLIRLQRQAHGLDADGSGDEGKSLEDLLKEVGGDDDQE